MEVLLLGIKQPQMYHKKPREYKELRQLKLKYIYIISYINIVTPRFYSSKALFL